MWPEKRHLPTPMSLYPEAEYRVSFYLEDTVQEACISLLHRLSQWSYWDNTDNSLTTKLIYNLICGQTHRKINQTYSAIKYKNRELRRE